MPHSQIASSVQYGSMVDRHIIRSSGLGLITRHTFRVFRKAFIHLNDMTLQSLKLCKTGMMENILEKSLEYLIVALFCFILLIMLLSYTVVWALGTAVWQTLLVLRNLAQRLRSFIVPRVASLRAPSKLKAALSRLIGV